jgi:RHS repeat-associated protein
MRDRSIRIAFSALLATTTLVTPAFGQSYQPMERQAPDDNGVDVISGKVTIPLKTVTVGSGDSSMTYSKGFAAGQPWDTFDVKIFNGGVGQPTLVTLFGDQRRFTGSAPNWTNADGDGGTLTSDANGYTYTDRDGSVFLFLNSLGDTSGSVKARVSTITRPNGEIWTYYYKILSGVKRVQSVTSNLGYQLITAYASNVSGPDFTKLIGVGAINNTVDYCDPTADGCPNQTQTWPAVSFTYTTGGGTTTEDISDVENNVSKILYTLLGGPTSYTPASSQSPSLTINYYGDGRVQNLSKGGGTWGYSYVDNGNQRTTTVTQPLGGSKIYVSDLALKRVLSVTDELSRTTSFQYDSLGRLTRTTQPEGNYTQLTYDARGNVTETRAIDKPSTSLPDIVATASYPGSCTNPKTCNQPGSITDARGNVTSYAYDAAHGGVTSITLPAPTVGAVQPQVRYSYTSLYAWYKNAAGTIVQAPSPITTLTGVSQCQTLTSCTGALDETKTALIRGTSGVANNLLVTSSSSGAGNGSLTSTSTFTYNSVGMIASSDGPLTGNVDRIDYTYDEELWRLTTVTRDPDGTGPAILRYTYLYDADGRVTRVRIFGGGTPATDTLNSVFTYDALGRVTERELASGLFTLTTHSVTQFTYDAKGRLQCENVRMNPANFTSIGPSCTLSTAGSFGPDRITRFEYSNADEVTIRKVAYLTSDAADELTLTYTNNGQLQTLKDAENNLTTYEYDGHDRLEKTRFPVTTKGANQSSTTDYEQLTYDTNGNVTNRRLRDAQNIAFTYDSLNRPTLKNLPGSEPDVTYGYDNLGRPTFATQTGSNLTFTYDALSRNLTQVGPQGTISSQWDIGGRRTKLTYPDGFYLDYDYDDRGLLWHIRENGAASGVGVLATFAYGPFDRRASITFGNGAVTSYSYTTFNTLATLANDFPGTANDQHSTLSYNPAQQLVGITRTNDAYAWTGHFNQNVTGTANGLNQLSSVGPKSLTHDARGNVTAFGSKSFTYSSENLMTTGPGSTSLGYDPAMRLQQVVSGGTTKMAYDDLDRLLEYDGSNAIQRRYVFGPDIDEPLTWYEGSGTSNRRFLGADERGSVISVTDSAGTMLGINRYDEYGLPQSTNLGNFGYAGQAWLQATSIWYYKARIFDSEIGRFLQIDPIGFGDGPNLYAYVLNDPANLNDPLGLKSTEWCEWTVEFDENGNPRGPAKKRCWTITEPDEDPFLGNLRWSGFELTFGGPLGLTPAQSPDRCAAFATPPLSGTAPYIVDKNQLFSIAQTKYLQHSWPIGPSGRLQSTFGGVMTSGEKVARGAAFLIGTRSAVPAGALHSRITGSLGVTTGRDIFSKNPTTTYMTVIIGPATGVTKGMLERPVISIFPGC